MRILIVAQHYAVCSARYAADAFTRLGHDVRHVGPAMGNQIWGLSLPERYVWEPDGSFEMGFRANFVALYGEAIGQSGWHPDVVIYMDSDPAILDNEVLAINDWYITEVPRIVWGVDNHVRSYRRDHIQHYFLAHRAVSLESFAQPHNLLPEHRDMTHLACAYDPTLFTPSTIPWAEREYDVCCLGVMYPQRVELVNAMQAAGLKVLWGCGLVYESYAAAMQNSRVSLCVSARGDLAQRIFESAACGCAVLSDPIADLDALSNIHPINIYHDINGAVAQAKRLQSLPEAGELASEWAAPHMWDARAAQLLATCAEQGLIQAEATA